MASFNFETLNRNRKPHRVDGANDNIPRIKLPVVNQAISLTLEKLLIAAAEAEHAMRTRTLIYNTNIHKALLAAAGEPVSKATRRWREKCKGAFFTVQQNGEHVLAVSSRVGEIRDYGGFRAEIYRSLERKNLFPEGMAEKHVCEIIEIIDPKKNDLICETGAGLDQPRIETLARLASEKGAHFICHDVVPLVMQEGQIKMPHIPYIALPPFPAFLGRTLNSVSTRKVITMKNTLTSINSNEIEDWLEVLETSDIDRVVVTQSIAPNLDVLVNGGQKAIEQTCESLAAKSARERTDNDQSLMMAAVIISERSKQIAYTALLEILIQNLADRAAKKGFNITQKLKTNATADIRDEEAIANFLADKGIASYMSDFQKGTFNELTFTPTAILYGKVADVPQQTLRIRSQQIHIVLERKVASITAINACTRNEMGIPMPAFFALKKWIPNIAIDELQFDPADEAMLKNEATYVGLAAAFDYLGDIVNLTEVKQYRETPFERAMYESFGVTVDS